MTTIDRIYDALTSEEAYALLPVALSEAVKARSCVMQRFDGAGILQEINFNYFTDEMNIYYGANELFHSDLWSKVAIERGAVGRAVGLGEMVGDSQYRSSRFYNDFIRHFGDDTGQCIGLALQQSDGEFVTIGLHRPFRDRQFASGALGVLDRLRPHLTRLLTMRARLRQLEEGALLARAGIDAVDQAVILADEFGRPLLVNRVAEQILALHDGIALQRGRLTVADGRAQQTLHRAIYEAARRIGHRGGACLVERPSGKRAFRAAIAPLGLAHRSGAMILIDDPDRQPPVPAADLTRLYGLTVVEAQIALAIGQGHTPEEIADQRSVSLPTIRTQIQSIFRKTDTHRIAELVLLLARLPRVSLD